MLVSLSTGGIICLAICWCYYFFFIKDKKNSTTKMLLFLIGIGAAIFIVQSQAHLVQTVLNRLTELGSTIYDTSANRRIFEGLLCVVRVVAHTEDFWDRLGLFEILHHKIEY